MSENIKTKPLIIAGLIESPQGLKDGTLKFIFKCNEQTPEKAGQLFSLNNKFVYLMIKEETFLNEEMELMKEFESSETVGKKPSERMRNVLFVNWKNANEGFESFTQYYNSKMEKIIEHYKSKLPVD